MSRELKNFRLASTLVLALVLAWVNHFVQDDAFISFRYARNLAEGYGLVWNIGERVEGYTNFLWTLCMAPAFIFKIDPVSYSYVVSIAAFLVTLVFAYLLAVELWGRKEAGVFSVLLLATNFSFSSYATGGLETQFGIAWVMVSVWLIERWWQAHGNAYFLICAGMTSAFAVMTRMDAVVLLAPFWLGAVLAVGQAHDKKQVGILGVSLGLASLMVVGWLIWRYSYYHAWVPNTFFIKSAGVSWLRGGYYVCLFYFVYGFWLLSPLAWPSWREKRKNARFVVLAGGWLLWQVYVVSIGGDFMEFRMMMPSLPFLAVALAGAVPTERMQHRDICCVVVMIVMVVMSGLHGLMQYGYPCVDTVGKLKQQIVEWKEVAEILNTALGEDKRSVKIGITCAGVIPFYTMMPTLDLLGLNDSEVARGGKRIRVATQWIGNRPGHVRMATWGQVCDKGVHLLINTPWILNISSDGLKRLSAKDVVKGAFWRGGYESAGAVQFPENGCDTPKVIAWPCGNDRYLITVYTKATSFVDEAVLRAGAIVISDSNEQGTGSR